MATRCSALGDLILCTSYACLPLKHKLTCGEHILFIQGHVRRKVRQACGIPDRQITSWPAKTDALRLDPTFQAYLKYHLEDATDDDHNSGIIERIKDIFLGDRAVSGVNRRCGRGD